MLKTLFKSISRLTRNCKRQYCWCPNEPRETCVEAIILPNGVKVVTEEFESPLTCVSLSVSVGSRFETVCTNGLTHFIEHLAFKGFTSMNQTKLEETVMNMGARLSVRTTRDLQVFSVVLPSECAPDAVEILYKIVCQLDLNDREINKERKNIYQELYDADANPKKVVFDYLHATAFQGTPLAQRVIGTSANIARFNACLAFNFMNENYQPYRFVLASSGKMTHKRHMQKAETHFGSLAPQPCCDPDSRPHRFTGSQVIYRDDSMPFCHAAIAFEAPGFCGSDYYYMQVLKNIVGKWDRSQGRGVFNAPIVAREVSMQKLCESYEAFYIAYREVGLWGVYFVADKWKLDEIVFYIQDQWMQLCTVIRQTDVDRGVNQLRLKLAHRYGSVVRSSHNLGKQLMYSCAATPLQNILADLSNLKLQRVRALADQMLYDKCPAVAVMGPSETMPDYVRIRSGQWWLRL